MTAGGKGLPDRLMGIRISLAILFKRCSISRALCLQRYDASHPEEY